MMKRIIFLLLLLLVSCTSKPQDLLNYNLKGHSSLALHIHPYLDIEIFGEKYEIPANIGIYKNNMRVINTHDLSGKLHVESPYAHQFFLEDFFTIWDETFNESCIFDYCTNETRKLELYVDGNLYNNFNVL